MIETRDARETTRVRPFANARTVRAGRTRGGGARAGAARRDKNKQIYIGGATAETCLERIPSMAKNGA